jgi:sugar phosphate isomerase/epimerase
MHLGVVTYNVLKDWDLDTILSRLQELGYEAVELRTGHAHGVEPSLNDAAREAVHKKFARSKLRLLSYGTTCEFHSPDAAVRRKNVEEGKRWVDLAHDTGALGIKVRPNGLPKEVPREQTIRGIGEALSELGDYGSEKGIEIWMEVHGPDTQNPPVSAAILKAANHGNVGACWNSNPTDVVDGSVKASFDLLAPYIRNCHINELTNDYPWRELFTLLRKSGYQRYTLCEAGESKEPERFLRYYKSLWTELNREC